jgi:hypothetical protein
MATAFYGTIIIRGDSGRMQVDKFNSTDVTLAYVTFTSTGGLAFLDVLENGFITDIVTNITSAGDTKDFKLFINQTDTNIRWVQSASFPTINNRFLNNNPVRVTKGQRIQIQAI